MGQLDDEEHTITFCGGTWKITKSFYGCWLVAHGNKVGTLNMTSKCKYMILLLIAIPSQIYSITDSRI